MFSRIPTIVWFLVPTVVILVVGVYFVSKMSASDKKADETLPQAVSAPVEGTQDFQIVSREHIAEGTNGSGYNSNPPSSGPHWASPAGKGIYEESFPDEKLIHNLEHGYIWIAFKKEVGEDAIKQLSDLVKADDYKIVMAPRETNGSKIALVAWGRVLKMDSLDIEKCKEFIRTYRNRGPERTQEG